MPFWPTSRVSEADFIRDLTGSYTSLRSYAAWKALTSTRSAPPRRGQSTPTELVERGGNVQDVRELRVVKEGDRWQVEWPINREPKLPPQVIPVNYVRWT